MSFYFVIIMISAFIDIVANLLLKKSDGFKYKTYGISAILLVIIAFIFLSFALEYVELSIAYSTWGAIGIIGTSLGGYIFYKERLNYVGILGVIVVVCAVILLNY
ncbi:SMR family transporter [Helicobacter sp. MIT 99-5507]|uniref:SMR family transporter n=1 Tax=Helicobacter sp. MIT 99-5507 TaxID=152489 RepID=UPI000E1F9EB7|nr:SMR family transporter [Helicobacter sp. MIT 99-5507]RDU58481.1 QacE family quaternary ammonium compound efflux SMR transporter [Helicobacter sp. MIT 99-5507]